METGERIFVIVQDQLEFMWEGTEKCVVVQIIGGPHGRLPRWLTNTSGARLPGFKASLSFLRYMTSDESLLLLKSGILVSYREDDGHIYLIGYYKD